MSIKKALSVRSDHSLGESTLQVDTAVARAKELGYDTLAITDTMSVSSVVALSGKCKKEGIKPIIGCVVRVVDDPLYRKPKKGSGEVEKRNHGFNLKVYVKTDAGLRSLMKLLTKGNSADYFYYVSRVGLSEVMELTDVIVTTGDMFNLFHHPDHLSILEKLAGVHPTYVELVPINTPLFDTLNTKAVAAATALNVPVTAGYPVFYSTVEDADSLDVLRAITSNNKMGSRTLPIPYTRDLCFAEPQDIAKRMLDMARRGICSTEVIKQALLGPTAIAAACDYEFKKLAPSLPVMAENEFLKLVEECKAGWNRRFARPVLGHVPTDLQVYKERLQYELGVIKQLGFSNYFLLVQDIVNWSKQNGVVVGPGRGSVGGSLIAYLMGITDVDPIRFDLLFERFINPERIDLPDADLDFQSTRRHEVVAYISEKYGHENVAGISNYSTLGAASAIRDVSRVHELDIFEYQCSKQVEKEHGVSLSLEESATAVPDISKFRDKYPTVWKHAVNLEGCLRNMGQHAAGVVVAGEPVANRAVLKRADEGGLPVVYWDKQVVEDWGLIKMDILGLTTLDVLKLAADFIKERKNVDIDFLTIPLDDAAVMKSFGEGNTVGVFQFEGSGMRKLLKDLAMLTPLNFEDIAAATALYRPGPIDAGLVDQFVAVKQGMKLPEYEHPLMENALANTYGVITYQEQVMQVCRDLAGFTMVEADHVRKAMGKKDKVKMAEYRELFVAGATKAGMGEYAASLLWDKIEGFAGYAFNKSHSVEYSVISYWAMWLKVNYPAEFYAAAMTVMNDKEDKVVALVTDAKAMGLKILPPDINISTDRIEILNDNELYAPFQAVKGISGNVAGHILRVKELNREGFFDVQPFELPDGTVGENQVCVRPPKEGFESFADFEAAVVAAGLASKINKSHRDKLSRVGAFASIEPETPPALSEQRLKDRLELMPGFTVEIVKAERGIPSDQKTKLQVISLVEETRNCEGCSLKDQPHPMVTLGKTPRFMMVFDSPTYQEGKKDKMLEGDNGAYIKAALKDVGLSANDGYFTSLVKAPKPAGSKGLTNDQINGCTGYLKREIEILKPAVIVAMGTNAVRYFVPGIKGAPGDYAGKVIFDPELDASIVLGVNPASLHFDGSKIKLLQGAVATLATLLS